MGGLGSGRHPTSLRVEDCRCLDIGELADGGRLYRIPHGRILWRRYRYGPTVGRLTYRFTKERRLSDGAWLPMLTYIYWSGPDGFESGECLRLEIEFGKRTLLTCPRCWRAVRRLYVAPGEMCFLCRYCLKLRYPPSTWEQTLEQARQCEGRIYARLEAADLARLSGQRMPAPPSESEALAALAELGLEDDPGPEVLRLACLWLGFAGLSCRAIATHVPLSKSTVHRLLTAGFACFDLSEFLDERARQRWAGFTPSEDPRILAWQLALERREARQLALERCEARQRPRGEPEVKLLMPRERSDREPSDAAQRF